MVRRIPVKDFRYLIHALAGPILLQCGKPLEASLAALGHPGRRHQNHAITKGTHEPRPDGSLMIRCISRYDISTKTSRDNWGSLGESVRRPNGVSNFTFHYRQHLTGGFRFQQFVWQADGENLVRTGSTRRCWPPPSTTSNRQLREPFQNLA